MVYAIEPVKINKIKGAEVTVFTLLVSSPIVKITCISHHVDILRIINYDTYGPGSK